MKRFCLAVFALVTLFQARATHLVHLDGYVECTGSTSAGTGYQVTFRAVRDAWMSTLPFDPSMQIGVYRKSNGMLHSVIELEMTTRRIVFRQVVTDIWFEEAVYSAYIELPNVAEGYILQYRRCCASSYLNIINEVGLEALVYIPEGMVQGQHTLKPAQPLMPVFRINQTHTINFPWSHNLYDSVRFESLDYFMGGDITDPMPVQEQYIQYGQKGSFTNGAAPGNPFGVHGTWMQNSPNTYQIHLTGAQRFIYPITSTCYLNGDSIKQTVVFPAIGVNADFPLLWLEFVEREFNQIELSATSLDWTAIDSILLQRWDEGMSPGTFVTIDPNVSSGASVLLTDAAINNSTTYEYRIKLVSNGQDYYSNTVRSEGDSTTVSVHMPHGRLLSLVYPNPSAGLIYIQTPLAGPYTLRNTSGQMLGTGMLKEGLNPLDFQSLPNGIYFLSTESETVRIVLMH